MFPRFFLVQQSFRDTLFRYDDADTDSGIDDLILFAEWDFDILCRENWGGCDEEGRCLEICFMMVLDFDCL